MGDQLLRSTLEIESHDFTVSVGKNESFCGVDEKAGSRLGISASGDVGKNESFCGVDEKAVSRLGISASGDDENSGIRLDQTSSGGPPPHRARAYPPKVIHSGFDMLEFCLDYRHNGYCRYGDSCEFTHEPPAGYMPRRRPREDLSAPVDPYPIESADDGPRSLPSVCAICNNSFLTAVVTQCNHYFCQYCALKHHCKSGGKCYVCKRRNREFNFVHDPREVMAAKRN